MAQEIDLIKKKKNSITISSSNSGTISGLTDIHTVKEDFIWYVPDSSLEWINFNSYELLNVNRIVIKFEGITTGFLLEVSNDGFNWNTLTDTFIPDLELKEADITYTTPIEFVFLKLTITGTSGFSIYDYRIYADVIVENTHFLSHNYYTFYDIKEREEYPFLPSIFKSVLEMWADESNIDLKIFDPTLFSNSSISKSIDSTGNTITLSSNNIPVLANTQYIWDFNDSNEVIINNNDGTIDLSVSNIEITTNTDFSMYSVDQFSGYVLEIISGVSNKKEFTITGHTVNDSSTGNIITIDSGEPFILSETEVDWQIKKIMEVDALSNPNIINTSNPLIDQQHTYGFSGTYYPRLVLKNPKYVLEFTQTITV